MSWSKRIVVGFDGSPPAQRALARAADLARPGDTIVVVHVGPDGSPALERARQFLADRLIDSQTFAATGEPAAGIADAARQHGADLIVIGHHPGRPRGGVGSVGADLLRVAPCDVLAVHAA